MAGLVLWGPVHSWDVELDDTHRHADAHTLEFLAASIHYSCLLTVTRPQLGPGAGSHTHTHTHTRVPGGQRPSLVTFTDPDLSATPLLAHGLHQSSSRVPVSALILRPGVGCGCPDQGPCGTSKGL